MPGPRATPCDMRTCVQILASILLAAPACGPALAQTHWLTIVGDMTDPAVDTVEVSPDSVVGLDELRVMKIRTNRKQERITYDHKPYRSYFGSIQIDCVRKEARFRQIRYFLGPMWTGAARDVEYPEAAMPPVALRDFQPNPVQRIVQAACNISSVRSR